MLGPHFYYDLVRLARKPRNTLIRCGFLLSLLGGWWLVYEFADFKLDRINDFARLASTYANAILLFQYALIMLLTPIYLAGLIVEEKENGTLELLYQTELTDSQILLGKFAARVVHLMLLSLSSLPLLSIISLWGGVSFEELLLQLICSLLLILSLGSISLLAAVMSTRMLDAMVMAYGLGFTLVYYAIAGVEVYLKSRMQPGLGWTVSVVSVGTILALLFSGTLYYFSLRQFRKLRNLNWMASKKGPPPRARRRQKPSSVRIPRPRRSEPGRRVSDNALWWREANVRRFLVIPRVQGALMFTLIALVPWVGSFLYNADGEIAQALGIFIKVVYYSGFAATFAVFIAVMVFETTASVAHDREQNTLDFLLLLPVERWEILMWKGLGPWIRNWQLAAFLGTASLFGSLSGLFPWPSGFWLLVLPLTGLWFLTGASLLLSVACRRVLTANIILIGIVLALFLALLMFHRQTVLSIRGYLEMLIPLEQPVIARLNQEDWDRALILIILQQQAFILIGCACFALAFWLFARKTSETRTQVW